MRIGVILILILAATFSTSMSRQSGNPPRNQSGQEQEEQPGNETARPRNENKHYSVNVTVLTESDSGKSPVKGAGVTIFAGDYRETSKTGNEGTVQFKFDATTKNATIRVVADHYITDQQQISLKEAGNEHRVVLKKVD